jgi:hypothetical protein
MRIGRIHCLSGTIKARFVVWSEGNLPALKVSPHHSSHRLITMLILAGPTRSRTYINQTVSTSPYSHI